MPDGIVVPLRTPAFRLGDAMDLNFFRRHPDRKNHIRGAYPAEERQARCSHGEPRAGRNYLVAVRLVAPGLFHRRFVLNGPGDGSETCCRDVFDCGLIAGEVPRSAEADPEPGAA